MFRIYTTLLFSAVATVALLALCTTSILSPAWAQNPGGGPLACADGQGAFFSSANTWECADITGPPKFVFVTSTLTDGTMSFNGAQTGCTGIECANKECNDLASDEGLPGTYMAWLSDATASPDDDFEHSAGPYELVTKLIPVPFFTVAYNWDDLTDTAINMPILCDETGSCWPDDAFFVWTGTWWDGTTSIFGRLSHCDGWTTNDTSAFGTVGGISTSKIYIDWTRMPTTHETPNGATPCDQQNHIYCFQQ